MDIAGYLDKIRHLYNGGQTTEHSFRPALAFLFDSIDPAIEVINEPKRLTDIGAPDFVFNRNGIGIGWCEAKDLDKDIQKFAATDYSKAQKKRYTNGLPNLLYTNGIDFEFIRNGDVIAFVSIADFGLGIPARQDNFKTLELLLKEFVSQTPVSITTAEKLAQMMAGKAELIKDTMGNALAADDKAGAKTELMGQYEAFKANLIADISIAEFADIYAETIAYGLFAARLHDTTLETFSRGEALELLPKSNPFLRKLFIYIAGPDLDDRIIRMVDQLCDIFRATDLGGLLKDFGKFTARNDPFLHFYETFLGEYNPKKKKARGVWYTPEPVVNFIVRAVDDVLKSEFGLADGLADTCKIAVDWDTGQTDKKGKAVTIKKDVHRVQILDPATGTGTFLAEVIKLVAGRINDVAPAIWSQYVERDLLPRLNGFELLMASYAMCHMKLDMMLTEMGYTPSSTPPRLQVYLTNSLEEGEKVEQNLFAQWLANEAKEASDIKRQTPIMCIIGNPPYAVSSSNKSDFIENLLVDYKKNLNERNIQPLSDDYIKFLRYSQYLIEKNGEGVLGFITNNSYLDGLIHRQMRKDMLRAFDSIYVIDLHGSSKKQERAPDGSADTNVFDIMQGVSIIIAVKKKGADKGLAKVKHLDLWGSRKSKNETLFDANIKSKKFQTIGTPKPNHYLVPKEFRAQAKYEEGFPISSFFPLNQSGLVSSRDSLLIQKDRENIKTILYDFINLNEGDLIKLYPSAKDSRDWKLQSAKNDAQQSSIQKVAYRPFDTNFLPYSETSKGILSYPRYETGRHMLKANLAISFNRQIEIKRDFTDIFIINNLFDKHGLSLKENNNYAPLYLYPEEDTLDQNIRLNFDPKIYNQIRTKAGLGKAAFDGNNDGFRTATGDDRPDEIKVFDYIYGVLHSPEYRETYKEFLKIDFPRIPYPASPQSFAEISQHGEALRRLHLMEDAAIGATPYRFEGTAPEDDGDGADNIVDKPRFEPNPAGSQPVKGPHSATNKSNASTSSARTGGSAFTGSAEADGAVGRVYINGKAGAQNGEGQYFADVPERAWNFYIGGYQPAQKWLKDRKGRALSFDDIRHYQKIIKILCETHNIMQMITMPKT